MVAVQVVALDDDIQIHSPTDIIIIIIIIILKKSLDYRATNTLTTKAHGRCTMSPVN